MSFLDEIPRGGEGTSRVLVLEKELEREEGTP